jgi:hypothetical protein
MKQIIAILATILLFATASAIQIEPTYDTNVIIKDFTSQINLTLEINNADPGNYNLYTLADLSIQPSEQFYINTDTITKTFTIAPTQSLNFTGNYAFTYTLNQRGIEKHENRMLLKILELSDAIEITAQSTENSTDIKLYIQNKEATTIKNLTATFSSILFETKPITFDLEPNQKLELTIPTNQQKIKTTKAGTYIIQATFQSNNEEKQIKGTLHLGEKEGITTIQDSTGTLIQTQTISKINTGNTIQHTKIEIKKNILSRLFTSFETTPTTTQRSKMTITYAWIDEKFEPSETLTVKATTNYLFPIIIIFLCILAYFAYKRFSETKLEIKKTVTPVKTQNDTFALKVKLSIKARQQLENLSITDKIPSIVKVYKKFGTIKPDKIDTTSRRLHWNIGNLEIGEERIIDYIIYSKVGVVGKFSLPKALATFEKENEIHELESNAVFFMNEQSEN